MDGKKLLTGGTLAVSVASLAVGSVALATQPKIPETTQIEQSPIIIPLDGEKPTINLEEVHKWIKDGVDQVKREINEEKKRETLKLREEISIVGVDTSVASRKLNQTIEDINENTKVFNENFKIMDEKLKDAINKFAEEKAAITLWRAEIDKKLEDFKKKYEEIKELDKVLRTIKAVDDIRNATDWVQKTLEDNLNVKTRMESVLKQLKEKYPEFFI